MDQLIVAWKNGLFTPKLILTIVFTFPIWAGFLIYKYHKYTIGD